RPQPRNRTAAEPAPAAPSAPKAAPPVEPGPAAPAVAGSDGSGRAASAVATVAMPRNGARPLASPAVRKRGRDIGIALQFVPGSRPGGRITQQDLDAAATGGMPSSPAPTAPPVASPTAPPCPISPSPPPRPPLTGAADDIDDIPVTGLRRVIAERLQQSKR